MVERARGIAGRSRFGAEAVLILLLAAALTLVWVGTRELIAREESQAIRTNFADVRGLARLLAAQWGETVHRVALLQQLAGDVTQAQLRDEPARDELLRELKRAAEFSGPALVQIAGIDPRGALLWSTMEMPPTPINLAGREHVMAIAIDGLDSFVGQPVRGAVSGRWSIQFSAGHWSAARGGAARVLRSISVVSIDADMAHQLATEMGLSEPDVIAVVRGDGLILAHSDEAKIGTRIAPAMSHLRASAEPGSAEWRGRGVSDGRTRFYVARAIPGADMHVVVGRDEAAQMAPARNAEEQTRRSAILLSLTLSLLAIGAIAAVRHNRTLRDERQRAALIAQREGLLRQIAERASDLIALHDGAMRTIYANPAHRTMLGQDPADLLGRDFTEGVIAEDGEAIDIQIASLQHEGGARRLTFRARHADGHTLWLETEIVAIPPGLGAQSQVRAISISRDVTRRMQNQQALARTTEQLEALLRLGPGILYRRVVAADGSNLLEFPAQGAAFPWGSETEGEAAASSFERAIDPADAGVRERAIERCMRFGLSVVEYRCLDITGATFWIRDEMRMGAPEENGAVIIGYLTDVSEEYANRARLKQAERLATLGEVAAAIAHEMNVPLATISMAAENGLRHIERGRGADESVAAKLRRIIAQSQRITRVIEHVRLFGRGEPAETGDFALDELVRDALLLTQSKIQTARVSITLDLPADLPRLHAAPMLLEQVLMNLIVNAADAYDSQPEDSARTIHIAARRQRDSLLLSVTDRAGGIPPAIMDRVFEPFLTTKPPGKGTGLGLSISFASISEMGGTIRARNENGGAVFEIELPLVDVESLDGQGVAEAV